MNNKCSCVIIVVIIVALTGCRSASSPTATLPPPTATDVPATPTGPLPSLATSPTLQPTAMATLTSTPTPRPSATSPPASTPTASASPTPQPTATSTDEPTSIPIVPLAQLSAAQAGQEVTVGGQVIGTASFSHGFKFTLDDGTGQVVLLMWHNVYDDCWDAPQLNIGATVRATGEVGEFEGELQIEPGFGGDVQVTAPGGPFAPGREIGSLSAYVGQRVMIEGYVVRTAGSGSGVTVFVGDDTGDIGVYIWNNILERISENTGLGTDGTPVRVVGVVQEYRSNLQVVPVLPYDVVILH